MKYPNKVNVPRFFRPSVPWVVVLGLDGSGKSTVLKELEKGFTSPLFVGLKVVYRRPYLLMAQPQYSGGPVIDHYAKPSHGSIKSMIKLGLRALDWWLGYWGRVAYPRIQGYLVLLDRHYFLDICVDPLRYRYGGPSWLAHRLGLLLPKPDLFIMLDAPVEVLQRRKQEVTPEEGARQRTAYLKLMQSLANSYIVDASQPLDEVVAKVKEIILDYISQYRQPTVVKKPGFPPALAGRARAPVPGTGVKGLLGRLSSKIKGLNLAITKRR